MNIYKNEAMQVYIKCPQTTQLSGFLAKEKARSFTYTELGETQKAKLVAGFDNDLLVGKIGQGSADFEKAKDAIRSWVMFPTAWTKILPEKPPMQTGENVAMLAQFMGLWWRNSCKIIYTIDETRRFGFAYGTLPGHIETGEELFLVYLNDSEDVIYEIRAFSKPYHIFAKIGYPLVRFLQEKFRQDSLQSMRAFVQNAKIA